MDVKFINTFTEVVLSTFETSCNAKSFRYADFEKVEGDISNDLDLMCVIEFSGDLSGALIMNFSEETANNVYGGMMMEEITQFNEEVAEGFSEILNMVIGNVKAELPKQNLEFQNPQSFIGTGYIFTNINSLPWLYIPMAFPDWGRFELYIGIKEN